MLHYSITHLGEADTSEAMTHDEQFHPSKPQQLELREEPDSRVFPKVVFFRNRALFTLFTVKLCIDVYFEYTSI